MPTIIADAGPLIALIDAADDRQGCWRIWRLVTVPCLRTLCPMPTATKLSPKKPARRRVTKMISLPAIKAVKGSPLVGLEHLIGCVTLPRDSRPRREILRARYLADHNT